jgi:hypothetical protein
MACRQTGGDGVDVFAELLNVDHGVAERFKTPLYQVKATSLNLPPSN